MFLCEHAERQHSLIVLPWLLQFEFKAYGSQNIDWQF
jgi:hypothetical protein